MAEDGARLHLLTTAQLLAELRRADADAVRATSAAADQIERAVEALVAAWPRGGRLIYVGAGTSGRIGAVDAAECRPTFGIAADRVMAIIAGGEDALARAVEGAEDDERAGSEAIEAIGCGPADVVVALSASGTTPYTCAALEAAVGRGSSGVAVTCAPTSRLTTRAAIPIVIDVGSEIIDGSTRMKAGTAQKLVCNSISTASFVRLGRVWDRHMVGVRTSSDKLRRRATDILQKLECTADEAAARELLAAAGEDLPTAIVMAHASIDRQRAERLLAESHGDVHAAIRLAGGAARR